MKIFFLIFSLVVTQNRTNTNVQSFDIEPLYLIENKSEIICDKHIIIGDSQTPYVDNGSKLANRISNSPGRKSLWQSGKTMNWLTSAVNDYKVDSTICSVIIVIGTNGGFGKYIKDEPDKLFLAVRKKFPLCKIYAVQGSWGWGGLKSIKEKHVRDYYNQWVKFGVTVIEPPIGKIEPHGMKPVYKEIGRNIDSLIRYD
jgi:hypothetical protein